MTQVITVKPSRNELTAYTFDDFLSEVHQKARPRSCVVLDLRELVFIDLLAIVGIIYCCADLHEELGCRVRLEIENSGACSFLPRIGFFSALSDRVEIPDVFTPNYLTLMEAYRGTNKELVELTPVNSPEVVRQLPTHLISVLRRQLKYPKNNAFDLGIMFSELCNNILDHNAGGVQGLAAMQVFNGSAGRFMQVVVADRGDGIKNTLVRNSRFKDVNTDTDAILKSIEEGASEHNDQTRGNGLYHLIRLAFEHQGTVHIRSGAGKIYLRADRSKAHRFDVPYLKGAQFSLSFRAVG